MIIFWEDLLGSGLSDKLDGPFYHYIINKIDHSYQTIQAENITKI